MTHGAHMNQPRDLKPLWAPGPCAEAYLASCRAAKGQAKEGSPGGAGLGDRQSQPPGLAPGDGRCSHPPASAAGLLPAPAPWCSLGRRQWLASQPQGAWLLINKNTEMRAVLTAGNRLGIACPDWFHPQPFGPSPRQSGGLCTLEQGFEKRKGAPEVLVLIP